MFCESALHRSGPGVPLHLIAQICCGAACMTAAIFIGLPSELSHRKLLFPSLVQAICFPEPLLSSNSTPDHCTPLPAVQLMLLKTCLLVRFRVLNSLSNDGDCHGGISSSESSGKLYVSEWKPVDAWSAERQVSGKGRRIEVARFRSKRSAIRFISFTVSEERDREKSQHRRPFALLSAAASLSHCGVHRSLHGIAAHIPVYLFKCAWAQYILLLGPNFDCCN